ncbi:sensor histidine kinase [Janthinobacterium sp.]|uniref:sensor histidine kinase n=1 Tax=Janthinobacterium sp. TaxID=1871054 RepID=UPI00293DA108|nr:sensor histidine kinase [Janthinobacterium sp.]
MIVARGSLYTRLVLRIGLVLLVSGAALLVAIWMATQLAANEAYDRLLTGNALQIAENTWLRDGAVTVDLPMAAFMLTPGVQTFYTVLDPDGRSIAGDPDFKPVIPWQRLEEGPILFDSNYQGLPVRIAVLGRRLALDHPRPWAVVAVAQTKAARSSFAKNASGNAFIVIVAMGVLTVLAAIFTLYQTLSPLSEIERAIAARDPNDLAPLAIEVPAEIHALVSSINGFMQRLARHQELMRRVIGDTAHQLRTPVAGLLSQMELLSMQTDEARKHIHLNRLRELTANLGHLIGQLINHAMVQHRANSAVMEAIDLAELVRGEMAEICSNYSLRNLDRLDLALLVPEHPCLIAGDATTLREAVKNIIGNALLYGAPGLLHVEVRELPGHCLVSFVDDGPGIPEADRERVRKPFSPRGGTRSGGSLGLSIVEQVMQAHGGQMTFGLDDAKHFMVQLKLRKAGP